jgi:hypothetical protein
MLHQPKWKTGTKPGAVIIQAFGGYNSFIFKRTHNRQRINNSNGNPMAQQPITGPGLPHCEVSRSCRKTPWASDQLASRWPSHHPFRRFLIIPDPPTRVLWQVDQHRHLAAKQGIGQETWSLNFAYGASLHSQGSFTCRKSTTWDRLFTSPTPEGSTQPLDHRGRSVRKICNIKTNRL